MINTQKRFVRQKDTPEFFGVTRGFFDKFIRPSLTEIWLGDTPQSGIVYDIFDLHALADMIKERNGRPARKGDKTWGVKQKVSSLLQERTLLTCLPKAHSSESELEEALVRHRKKKQS